MDRSNSVRTAHSKSQVIDGMSLQIAAHSEKWAFLWRKLIGSKCGVLICVWVQIAFIYMHIFIIGRWPCFHRLLLIYFFLLCHTRPSGNPFGWTYSELTKCAKLCAPDLLLQNNRVCNRFFFAISRLSTFRMCYKKVMLKIKYMNKKNSVNNLSVEFVLLPQSV